MSQDFWDGNADVWSKAIQSHLIESRKITNPAIVQEIVRHRPRRVLDLGCGEGWIASQLLPRGIQYMGLDFSPALIDIARKTSPGVSFEALDYENLARGDWKSSEKFDLVVFNFSLLDEDLRPILRAAGPLLSPSGKVLIQTLHPCFSLKPYEDGWRTEDFKSFPVPFEGTMPWFGRTLSSWVRVFSECKFKIDALVEPMDPESKVPLSLIFTLSLEK